MKTRKGIASFYIVAFSTLILTVIAVSFAAVIVSQVTKTSNDDLSQSAYDSALAGVEDAKIAYYNYQRCVESGSNAGDCGTINEVMEVEPTCNMVGKMLGKGDGEVLIQEETSGAGENMQQAYTCVEINNDLDRYTATLDSENSSKVVQVQLADGNASSVNTVRISWYSNKDDTGVDSGSYGFLRDAGVEFPNMDETTYTPPMISVGLVQTGETFTLDDFTKTEGGTTDRGTVYLVPTGESGKASNSVSDQNYKGAYDSVAGDNVISVNDFVKSNDREKTNLPYAVYCNDTKEFACTATLQLPEPVGGSRSNETFAFVISLPYGEPNTEFVMEFCTSSSMCDRVAATDSGSANGGGEDPLKLAMQVEIDSTGRANDLYRRVKVVMESNDTNFTYPSYALELLGGDGGDDEVLTKAMTVKKEYNFF